MDVVSLWAAFQSRFMTDQRGVSVTEYALLAALIAVIAMAAAVFLGDALDQRLSGG